jgi:hypothetical protein
VLFVTDVRLFFEARNLSVEVVRADEESEQGTIASASLAVSKAAYSCSLTRFSEESDILAKS